jgi:hypothetical protein
MKNKKWTREEAEQNKNKLLEELKEIPTSEENLDWVTKELNQLIDEEEVRQNNKTIDMDRKKLEKNIASNLTIDLDVEKFIEVTLLDIEQYANQRVIEELKLLVNTCNNSFGDAVLIIEKRVEKLEKEIKQKFDD